MPKISLKLSKIKINKILDYFISVDNDKELSHDNTYEFERKVRSNILKIIEIK